MSESFVLHGLHIGTTALLGWRSYETVHCVVYPAVPHRFNRLPELPCSVVPRSSWHGEAVKCSDSFSPARVPGLCASCLCSCFSPEHLNSIRLNLERGRRKRERRFTQVPPNPDRATAAVHAGRLNLVRYPVLSGSGGSVL
jgi:hypothetical protein